ncbi:uncharacterized protein [Lepeophtheirus salmonis]|nr:uncharacterized protein LOC121114617 isoform X1 [Lepeophtheirus salmonis]
MLKEFLVYSLLLLSYSQSASPEDYSYGDNDSDELSPRDPFEENLEEIKEEGVVRSQCDFFDEWSGDWFFPGERDAHAITNKSLGTLGICIEIRENEFFLVYDEALSCYKCIKIYDRHPNVLQFQEGTCKQALNEDWDPCDDITEDIPLQTSVKMTGEDISCPFNDSYTFSYDEDGLFCELPLSRLDQCMVPSKVLFKFTQCSNDLSSGKEESLLIYQVVNQKRGDPVFTLTCKGFWHSNSGSSTNYIIGTLNGPYTTPSLLDQIRCFTYHPYKGDRRQVRSYFDDGDPEEISPVNYEQEDEIHGFKVMQSRDSTCMDLMEGQVGVQKSMVLTPAPKVPNLMRDPDEDPCIFPYWASSLGEVYNLQYTYKYEFTDDGRKIWASNYSYHTQTSHLLSVMECHTIIEEDEEIIKLISKVTAECVSSFKCLKLYRRSDHIVELQEGVSSKFETDACSLLNFEDEKMSFRTLIRDEAPISPCIADGFHNVTELNWGRMTNPCGRVHGFKEVNVKCKGLEVIEFIQECEGIFKDSVHHCLGGWESEIPFKKLPQNQPALDNRLTFSTFNSIPYYNEYSDSSEEEEIPENVTYGFMIARPAKDPETSTFQPHRVCFIYFFYNQSYSWTVDTSGCLRNIRPGSEGKYRFNSTKLESCDGYSTLLLSNNLILITWLSISILLFFHEF